ncbi:hypothetical protein [Sphingomonas solaris]|uniref:Uncharacterized protein n=1 Tax=Alterirhizorhabdus solaris TaxID=2529389 RepID=A0A558R838_9SPHN|nr:hypothetical protein [Sphingomonas solaris]TVV75561.1 hypothetical protein FOY91_06790 [Sphingomonas solaris]
MTPGERSWLERSIAAWGEQAAQMQRIACTRQSIINRAGGLESVVDGLRARLAAAPAAPAEEPAPAPAAPIAADEALPATGMGDFGRYQAEAEAGARADPIWFMRSKRAGMIYSAMVCRRFGDHETAARYEVRADRADDACRAPGRVNAPAPAPIDMRPPPIALPFTAGPQLDLFA